jgi:hypothetical protein
MEGNNHESIDPNPGSEQATFGGQLNSSFGSDNPANSGNAPAGEGKLDDKSTSTGGGGVTGRVKSVASSVRSKAASIPSMLADGLEAGAEALRQRRAPTGEAAGSAVVIADDSSIAAVTVTLATGMQSSAEWLRDADIDKLKQGVEKQVKEHPARSLLVALGAGYLIGKALRR